MDKDVELLKDCIENRAPILLLGAGFSLDAKGKCGKQLMLGGELTQRLFDHVITPHKAEIGTKDLDKVDYAIKWKDLSAICDIIRNNGLIDERNALFEEWMSQCSYDKDSYYSYLLNVDWKYIFTLNIDDLVEHIFDDGGKKLLIWKISPKSYVDAPKDTVLVKMHGDVGKPDTYVFDEKEYRNFSSKDNWMLRKFADLYVSHDVIILGTQFQERDIEIALEKVFDFGCNNSNFHYYFISPGSFEGKVGDEIARKANFHHIKWTTKAFLEFLENEISQPKDAIQSICSQGIAFWNKELVSAQSKREDLDLYYGRPSEPRDFYYADDIVRKKEQDQIEEFLSNNTYGYIEIKGKPYIGKTCLAKRALTLGVERMFKTFYCPRTDLRYLQIVKQYLESASINDQIIFCFEDAAGFYRLLVEIVEEYKNRVKKLIIIVVSSDMTKSSNRYVFGAAPLLEIPLTEKVNSALGNSIYEKLNEKAQLGKLVNYADGRKDTVSYMKQIDDLIDVLYVAHHGKRFSDYFEGWLKMRDTDEQFTMFQVISLLTTMGEPNISINYLPDVAESLGCVKFDYPKFIQAFGEFCSNEDGFLKLRCSRLFTDVVLNNLSLDKRVTIIRSLVYTISKDLQEGDKTFNNELFKHLIRASSLKFIMGINERDAIDLLVGLQDDCKHLSYYWIQLGILHRNINEYDKAENAFEYARKSHGRDNYQIAHTTAKNYMEWGTWALDHAPSQAATLFEEGSERMLKMFLRWRYPDAICFSAHTYIDMNIKYYTQLNRIPPDTTWSMMNKFMEGYANNANLSDRLLRSIFSRMCDFARKNALPIEREKEIYQLIAGKETVIADSRVEWIDEELPLYE